MIIINLSESDLSYFNEIVDKNPDDTDVGRIIGFDGEAIVQIIINTSLALSSQFLTALGLYLNYKVAKRQEELKLKELNLKDRKEVKIDNKKKKFEIKVISGSKKLIYSDDNLEKEQADEIIKKIIHVLNDQE